CRTDPGTGWRPAQCGSRVSGAGALPDSPAEPGRLHEGNRAAESAGQHGAVSELAAQDEGEDRGTAFPRRARLHQDVSRSIDAHGTAVEQELIAWWALKDLNLRPKDYESAKLIMQTAVYQGPSSLRLCVSGGIGTRKQGRQGRRQRRRVQDNVRGCRG